MNPEFLTIFTHLFTAVIAGGIIGLERSFHGRLAGFRTHTLVSLASSLLMLVTLYQWQWLSGVPMDTLRTDPTRMAQGIMIGIVFFCAGVIFKEGFTVRGDDCRISLGYCGYRYSLWYRVLYTSNTRDDLHNWCVVFL